MPSVEHTLQFLRRGPNSFQFILCGLLLVLSGALASNAYAAEKYLQVHVGSVKTVRVGTVKRVIVGNDQVLKAAPIDNGNLLLLGKAAGVTEVYVWTRGDRRHVYSVHVYAKPQYDRLSLVRSIMAPFPKVKVDQHLGKTILTGKVDQRDFKRFQNLTKQLDNVISLVKPQLNVDIQKSIAFDVRIVEINRSYVRNLGVNWNDTAAGPAFGVVTNIIPNNDFGVVSAIEGGADIAGGGSLQNLLGRVGTGTTKLTGYLGFTSTFGSQLQLLQSEGVARVLAAPSLSTISGEKATFLAGGDLPVSTINQFGSTNVQFRPYGIQLEILPVIDRHNNIRSTITASMSSIDNSVIVNGIPGLRRRETSSTITARPGDTIIISGLVNASENTNIDAVPWLSEIPILGQLFRSKDFQQNRTELVITVTPRIQQPNTPIRPSLQAASQHLSHVLTGSDLLNEDLMK
ncbi:type II and III secretion system protein family protein [Salinisphaera sp.]|uniref:type II and III secretion system protein family protein n=1 Tax=Salinisphaera sp. TaxID=1914330 RepID=UPI002D78646F|nr:pilus assembly protein N-terminal domain-containing protein [Salinisphaera sp.]HET7314079.1 pilus assembly protein N-terminal domain-containing protein [Salinisphaera sp.]